MKHDATGEIDWQGATGNIQDATGEMRLAVRLAMARATARATVHGTVTELTGMRIALWWRLRRSERLSRGCARK